MIGRLSAILAAAMTLAAAASAQSYGPGEQVLAIGAAEFRPVSSPCVESLNPNDGYLASACGDYAPVQLPDGAQITMICLYAYDPDDASRVVADLEAVKMPAGGQPSGIVGVPGSALQADFDIGYGTVCTDPMNFVVHSTGDVDGQGAANLAYRVGATPMLSSRLGGVRIFWHREVSPLPAASSFDDVLLGSQYSQFIEALKAAGITGGCQASPPLYCPDRPITRAEMAVYLSLALGLHWPN